MGYQESLVYTDNKSVKKNNKEIKRLMDIFRKYDIRCDGDDGAHVSGICHFERQTAMFSKGMDAIIIVGDRSYQGNYINLFDLDLPENERPQFTDDELSLIKKVKIVFLDNIIQELLAAEQDGTCTHDSFTISATPPSNYDTVDAMANEIMAFIPEDSTIKNDEDVDLITDKIASIVQKYGYEFSVEEKDERISTGEIRYDTNIYINSILIGTISYLKWKKCYMSYFFTLIFGKRKRDLARRLLKTT